MHQPRIPLLRLLAGGSAIVASILLAFVIGAWWDELQQRGEATGPLAGLHSETTESLRDRTRPLRAPITLLNAADRPCCSDGFQAP